MNFLCKMGAEPSIGGDPLTQLIFWNFFFFKRNADSDKINGKYVVGDNTNPIKIN